MEIERQKKQFEVDELKMACLEDIRLTQWELADDIRDVIRIIGQIFYEYHDLNQQNY